jgi:hypothetical protein
MTPGPTTREEALALVAAIHVRALRRAAAHDATVEAEQASGRSRPRGHASADEPDAGRRPAPQPPAATITDDAHPGKPSGPGPARGEHIERGEATA